MQRIKTAENAQKIYKKHKKHTFIFLKFEKKCVKDKIKPTLISFGWVDIPSQGLKFIFIIVFVVVLYL